MKSLEELRLQIDSLDNELLQILQKRLGIVLEIGKLKEKSSTPIYHPEREKAIIERLGKLAEGGLLKKSAIEAIFLEIFAVSRNLERRERVSYLGPLGSYTHQAAESRFGATCEYFSEHTITAVFKSVECGRCEYGVIPIENNSNGMVGETLDLLGKTPLKIIAEVVMPIHHSLASFAPSIKEVQTIYSKDVAFGQCALFLNEYGLENIKQIPVDSTARAAQLAASNPNFAAICSHIAAKLYQIPILFENIEDTPNNKTRFIILGNFKNKKSGCDKTSVAVNLTNDSQKPGALLSLLQNFNDLGINMTALQSRPNQEDFSYWFFIDFDGYIDDSNVQELFKRHQKELKWLGSYLKV